MKRAFVSCLLLILMFEPGHGADISALPDAKTLATMLVGKVCVTSAGARFFFDRDGHYAYSGLWTSHGHYSVHAGTILVTFDHGLHRNFDIVLKNDVLHMNGIALVCQAR